jgi:hypothetical protein
MKLLLEPVAKPLRNLAASAVNLKLPQRKQKSAESEAGVMGLGDLPDVSPSPAKKASAFETSGRRSPFQQMPSRHLPGHRRFGSRFRDVSQVTAV